MKWIKYVLTMWANNYKALNCEAKIGFLFLIPPIIGVLFFVLNILGADINFYNILESWNCMYKYEWDFGSDSIVYSPTPAIPIYLGLMAIAGAYLIKGNIKKG